MNSGLTTDTVEKIKFVLSRHREIEVAILYGSRTKGSFKAGSDIDLALQGKNLDFSAMARLHHEIDELSLPYTFDFTIYDHINNADLREHIDRVGIRFYSA